MEAIPLLCWSVIKALDALKIPFISSVLLGLVALIFIFSCFHRFSVGLRSDQLAGQSSTVIIFGWSLGAAGRRQILLEKGADIFIEQMEHEVFWSLLVDVCVDFRLDRNSGPTPAHDVFPIFTDTGNTPDFKYFCDFVLFLQTLRPWSSNEIQHLLNQSNQGPQRCPSLNTSPGCLPVKLSEGLELTFLDNPLKAALVLVAWAPFPHHTFQIQSTSH